MSTAPHTVLEIDQKLADFMKGWYPDVEWQYEDGALLEDKDFKLYIEEEAENEEVQEIHEFILTTLMDSVRKSGKTLSDLDYKALLYGWKLTEPVDYESEINTALVNDADGIKTFIEDVKEYDVTDLSQLLPILLMKPNRKPWEQIYVESFLFQVQFEIFLACGQKFKGQAVVTDEEFKQLNFLPENLATFRDAQGTKTPPPETPESKITTAFLERNLRSVSSVPDTPSGERVSSNSCILETLFIKNTKNDIGNLEDWIALLQVWHQASKFDYGPLYARLGGPQNDVYLNKLLAGENVEQAIREYTGNDPEDWRYPGAMAYRAISFDEMLCELDNNEIPSQLSPQRSSLLTKTSIQAFCQIFRTHPQNLWSSILNTDRLLTDYTAWIPELEVMLNSIEDISVLESLREITSVALTHHEPRPNRDELKPLFTLSRVVTAKCLSVAKANSYTEVDNFRPMLTKAVSAHFENLKKPTAEASVEPPPVPPFPDHLLPIPPREVPAQSPPTRTAPRKLFAETPGEGDHPSTPDKLVFPTNFSEAPSEIQQPEPRKLALEDFEEDSERNPLLNSTDRNERATLLALMSQPSPSPAPTPTGNTPPKPVDPILDSHPQTKAEAKAFCIQYIKTYSQPSSNLTKDASDRQKFRKDTLTGILKHPDEYQSLFVDVGNSSELTRREVAWWAKHAVSDCLEGHQDQLVPLLHTPLNYRFYTLMKIRYPKLDFSVLESRYSDARACRDEYHALSDAFHVATRLRRRSQTPLARWLAQTPKDHAEDWANAIYATQVVDRDDTGDHYAYRFKDFFQLPVIKYAFKNVKEGIYDHRVLRPALVATWRKKPESYVKMFFEKSQSLAQSSTPDMNMIATLALQKLLEDYAGSRFRLVGMIINFLFGHPNRHFAQSVRRYLNAEETHRRQHKNEAIKFEGSWNRLMKQLENDGHLDPATKKLKHYPDKPGKPVKVYTKPSSLEERLTFVQELAGALELEPEQVTQLTPRSAPAA